MRSGGLFLLSIPFAIASTLRTLLYNKGILKSSRLSARVISVGNITAGGTGKTPMVICIGEILKSSSVPFAILSRGYGRKSSRPFIVNSAEGLSASDIGDEPKLLFDKLKCPLGIAADRYKSGSLLLKKFGQHVIILDDGFSHRQLARDIDILLIDAVNPFGGGFLPKGSRREPLLSLKRADIIVVTGDVTAERVEHVERIARKNGFVGKVFTATRKTECIAAPDGRTLSRDEIDGKSFFLFSGIEGHSKFEKSAILAGIKVSGSVSYPDHYPFDSSELDQLEKTANGIPLLTTEKDVARIGSTLNKLYTLRISMEVVERDSFRSHILALSVL